MTTVGGFPYETVILFERTKPVSSAPKGYPATWKEYVETVAGTSSADHDFNSYLKRRAIELQLAHYQGDSNPDGSFDTYDIAGSVHISERVIAASSDIVSVSTGASFYEAGMAHPNGEGGSNFTWSRRLHRVLIERDVFTQPPNRTLRRVAMAQFKNNENLQNSDNPDGIPLPWDHATIGPAGITWSFGPYELGGYASGGSAMIPWAVLKPYLRPDLPFAIKAIRATPEQH
jgi:hypothetical protein